GGGDGAEADDPRRREHGAERRRGLPRQARGRFPGGGVHFVRERPGGAGAAHRRGRRGDRRRAGTAVAARGAPTLGANDRRRGQRGLHPRLRRDRHHRDFRGRRPHRERAGARAGDAPRLRASPAGADPQPARRAPLLLADRHVRGRGADDRPPRLRQDRPGTRPQGEGAGDARGCLATLRRRRPVRSGGPAVRPRRPPRPPRRRRPRRHYPAAHTGDAGAHRRGGAGGDETERLPLQCRPRTDRRAGRPHGRPARRHDRGRRDRRDRPRAPAARPPALGRPEPDPPDPLRRPDAEVRPPRLRHHQRECPPLPRRGGIAQPRRQGAGLL
ncbi:MAG: D-3-phosphoglycerate dehydrogenase, partial [uncultured Thermomicrobiales bacterium]